jgi:hypothetical protein
MSSYLPNLCVFVGDSRANNFDTYSQSQDLNIHYIIQRGATVDILTDLTCSFLHMAKNTGIERSKKSPIELEHRT